MKRIVTHFINGWDPIGLFPMAPKDEYEREICLITGIINKYPGITTKELAIRIHRVFLEQFGSDVFKGDLKQCLGIATKIKACLGKK